MADEPGLFSIMRTLREGGSIGLPKPEDYERIITDHQARQKAANARDLLGEKFHDAVANWLEKGLTRHPAGEGVSSRASAAAGADFTDRIW